MAEKKAFIDTSPQSSIGSFESSDKGVKVSKKEKKKDKKDKKEKSFKKKKDIVSDSESNSGSEESIPKVTTIN